MGVGARLRAGQGVRARKLRLEPRLARGVGVRTAHRLRKEFLLCCASGGGVSACHEAHARGGARGARERRLRAGQAWREALRRGEREGESDETKLHVGVRGERGEDTV